MKKKRVICTETGYHCMTFGNTYEVHGENEFFFLLKDNDGDDSAYRKEAFFVVKEPKVSFIQWVKNFING